MSSREIATRIAAAERFELARSHGLEEVAAASLRSGESDTQFRARLLGHIAVRQLGGAFSFARAVIGLADGHLDGLERETFQESAKRAGMPFDPQRVFVPWSLMTRDLNTAGPGAGGYLVGTSTGEALDVLRPWSVTARAGIDSVENLRDNATLPRTASKVTGYWLSTETGQVTESQPALGSIALTPKSAGAFMEFSRNLSMQAAAEAYCRRELLRTLGTVVDAAVIGGSGASGQPTGLLNTPGLGTQSGTSLAQAGVTHMKALVAAANAPDEGISFLGTPAVRELLETRERATGLGFIWDNDLVASRPARVSTDVPAATLICGAWSEVLLALWGGGFVFEVNPYDPTGFKAGIIQARVLVSVDVAVKHADAFAVSSSIT